MPGEAGGPRLALPLAAGGGATLHCTALSRQAGAGDPVDGLQDSLEDLRRQLAVLQQELAG